MKPLVPLVFLFAAAGCSQLALGGRDVAPPADATRPAPRPGAEAPIPTSGANTAEALDTTTAAERAAATQVTAPAAAALGKTVATLGNPADPGFWLETPLVTSTRQGRVVAVSTGAKVQLELRPIDGPASAGSRISLAALRLLGVGLTGLHELEVYVE
jgi:hypothetical protein